MASASLKIIYGSAHSPMSPCCSTFSSCQRQKNERLIKLKNKSNQPGIQGWFNIQKLNSVINNISILENCIIISTEVEESLDKT